MTEDVCVVSEKVVQQKLLGKGEKEGQTVILNENEIKIKAVTQNKCRKKRNVEEDVLSLSKTRKEREILMNQQKEEEKQYGGTGKRTKSNGQKQKMKIN